jgi:uncharacterized protein YabE (DUF348 family)
LELEIRNYIINIINNYIKIIYLLIFLLEFPCLCFAYFPDRNIDFENSQKVIMLNDNGLHFKITTSAGTISELLKEKNIKLGDHDQVIPDVSAKIYSGFNIEIKRAVKIKVSVDGKSIEIYTLEKTIAKALAENNIILTRLDKTDPDLNSLPQNNLNVVVTRINVEEVTKQEDIDFKTTAKNDSKLGWREKKVEIPGEKGVREVKYKITYKNGKEVSRVILAKSVIKEPVTQVEVQGTYVKTGKAQKGQGTWYAYQGGMFAASLSIPRGGYAKVTNTANGKSVIVQINDSGPYGKGRIIDLDKVAFQKIASLGAGVIGVKVEEVLN